MPPTLNEILFNILPNLMDDHSYKKASIADAGQIEWYRAVKICDPFLPWLTFRHSNDISVDVSYLER